MNSSIFKVEIKLCKHTPTCPLALTVNTHICCVLRPPHSGRKRAPAENQKAALTSRPRAGKTLSAGQGSQRVWDGPTAIPPVVPRASQPKGAGGHRPTWRAWLQWRHLSTELYAAWGVGWGGTAYIPHGGHCFANGASRPPLDNLKHLLFLSHCDQMILK